MRVLIFHGYLLRGTGSNIYNTSLCRALAGMGHEVHICCQERHPEDVGLPEGVTVHNPDIGRILPVYVADEYEGFEAVPFPELSDEDLDHYLEANVAAVAAVAEEVAPDVALANHLIMGPVVMVRAVGGRVPYAVKVHGSALEYTVRPHRERFLPYAREGLAGASAVLVGSRHTAESLWEVMDDPQLPDRTRLGPPGVDIEAFRPRPAPEAAAGVRELADRLEGGQAEWGGEAGAADALRALDPEHERVVSYVGKLIVSKGVDLLLAAWPLVAGQVPDARLVVVGFGTYRQALHRLVDALAAGDLADIREIAARGRELEGGPEGELTYLAAFLDGMDDETARGYVAAAPAAAARVVFTGRLEHDDLPSLLPACEAQVVPSTFPEAFGMVAAEAACCGALPLSAAHSGLAEVTAVLARGVDPADAALLSFERGPGAVPQIADRLVQWLSREPAERARVRERLAETGRGRFGWDAVAEGVIAAARGELGGLPVPGAPEAAQ
jgi:glycosyltransferase involved in cell wall biosynthesis